MARIVHIEDDPANRLLVRGPASIEGAMRDLVASELGNTPTIARNAYIHPAVFEQYERHGRTIDALMRKAPREPSVKSEEPVEYYPEEAALMRFLERYG